MAELPGKSPVTKEFRLRMAAFFYFLGRLMAAALLAGLPVLYWKRVEVEWPYLGGAVCLVLMVMIVGRILAGGLRCVVCGGGLLVQGRSRLHGQAKRFLGISAPAQVAWDALLKDSYHCMHCYTRCASRRTVHRGLNPLTTRVRLDTQPVRPTEAAVDSGGPNIFESIMVAGSQTPVSAMPAPSVRTGAVPGAVPQEKSKPIPVAGPLPFSPFDAPKPPARPADGEKSPFGPVTAPPLPVAPREVPKGITPQRPVQTPPAPQPPVTPPPALAPAAMSPQSALDGHTSPFGLFKPPAAAGGGDEERPFNPFPAPAGGHVPAFATAPDLPAPGLPIAEPRQQPAPPAAERPRIPLSSAPAEPPKPKPSPFVPDTPAPSGGPAPIVLPTISNRGTPSPARPADTAAPARPAVSPQREAPSTFQSPVIAPVSPEARAAFSAGDSPDEPMITVPKLPALRAPLRARTEAAAPTAPVLPAPAPFAAPEIEPIAPSPLPVAPQASTPDHASPFRVPVAPAGPETSGPLPEHLLHEIVGVLETGRTSVQQAFDGMIQQLQAKIGNAVTSPIPPVRANAEPLRAATAPTPPRAATTPVAAPVVPVLPEPAPAVGNPVDAATLEPVHPVPPVAPVAVEFPALTPPAPVAPARPAPVPVLSPAALAPLEPAPRAAEPTAPVPAPLPAVVVDLPAPRIATAPIPALEPDRTAPQSPPVEHAAPVVMPTPEPVQDELPTVPAPRRANRPRRMPRLDPRVAAELGATLAGAFDRQSAAPVPAVRTELPLPAWPTSVPPSNGGQTPANGSNGHSAPSALLTVPVPPPVACAPQPAPAPVETSPDPDTAEFWDENTITAPFSFLKPTEDGFEATEPWPGFQPLNPADFKKQDIWPTSRPSLS